MNYLIRISYDGSKFYGFQRLNDYDTVQKLLEDALLVINKKEVLVKGAGRTDRGVHALDQCVSFKLDIDISKEGLKKALNSLVEPYIYVKEVLEVDEDFHARFNVLKKTYVYKINMGEYNPIEKDYVFQYNKKLDVTEMERALKYLEGTHDFRSFVKIDEEKDNYIRTIVQTSLIRDIKNVNMVTISILGTGFMRYMVRNIVGMLIEIGEGKFRSEDIISILELKDRKQAGICAPPCGLYLKDVYY